MREDQKKDPFNRRLRLLQYTLDWGFKEIPFTLYTYVLVAKILKNGAKSRYTKAEFKNYRYLNNFR